MKSTIKRILILGVWLIMAQQMAFGSDEATQGSPVAEVFNAAYQFGTAVEGSEVVHDFIIKNTGTAPLHIYKVKTG